MKRLTRSTSFPAAMVVLAGSLAFAMVDSTDQGIWPKSWPKELEQFRKQSRSFTGSELTAEMTHEIHFLNREEFEKAWPHILKLRTEGSPLLLESVQSARRPGAWVVAAGVRVLCPRTDSVAVPKEKRKLLEAVPPWPDYVNLPSGLVPEYVVIRDGKWAAFERSAILSGTEWRFRARFDIALIVDGSIVDLNRVPLPADTPIIDNRFNNRPTNAGDANR